MNRSQHNVLWFADAFDRVPAILSSLTVERDERMRMVHSVERGAGDGSAAMAGRAGMSIKEREMVS